MNTISLHSLYIAKIIVDAVLVFYTLLIYRKFHKTVDRLEALVLCRFAVFMGFLLTYLSYLSPIIILEVAGSIFLIFASALILYFISIQIKQPYRSHLHIGLLVFYILVYALLLLTNHSLQTKIILASGVLILQHLTFFYDYIRSRTSEYRLIIILLGLFLFIHLARLMNGLLYMDAIINPLRGDAVTAIALVLFVTIDVIITLNINTHLHLNKLFSDLEL